MKKLLIPSFSAAAAILVMAGPSVASAAILTAVPMQGGMVMPAVRYDANANRLSVTMPAIVPQLTPLLVSNPADAFDPADPWFFELDPSRDGAAFSRRYGFVMDVATDPLPAGKQMWLRKLSGPPELKFYRYSGVAPKAFAPIFGTSGVTNAMYWSGTMFHPAVAAPSGTNSYTATFEVILIDVASGTEVPGSSSGPLTLNWTNVPDGRPSLGAQQLIAIMCPPGTTTNWVIEAASAPTGATWSAITNPPVTIEGERCVLVERTASQLYFRARYVP